SILNKGMFLSESIIKKILNFEYHMDRPLNESEKGSGLGLALSKELIEKNEGKFWIQTNENITEIHFSLPMG
ncbi:MAG TPA: hypothetical protein PLL86_25365, partial [Leptospiraceae bacterium]|nr:hypothetical protein [Leptospiraceae bacterium]